MHLLQTLNQISTSFIVKIINLMKFSFYFWSAIFFLRRKLPSIQPDHHAPLPNPPQNSNFANFGLIWMKLGLEVKSGQQSSSPELFFDSTPLTPQSPYPIPP